MSNKKTIIGLVGKISSGKGAVADYLKKNRQASVYKFSDSLRELLSTVYLPNTRQNMQILSKILRQTFGEDLLAKIIARKVAQDKNKIIVVDGIRREKDIEFLKKTKGFILIKITADQKIRYKRLIKRKENQGDTKKTYKEFQEDEKKETEIEIPKIMAKAKKEINNNGNFASLHRQIDKTINF